MDQDGRASLPESSSDSLLQVVLLAFDRDGIRDPIRDHYAAIMFPRSYEEAITSIREAFKAYLRSKPEQDDRIDIYMPMLNLEGKSVFARADKKHWYLIVAKVRGSILGIREFDPPIQTAGAVPFFKGSVYVTYGYRNRGLTKWDQKTYGNSIDRPGSYQEALESIRLLKGAATQSQYKFYYFNGMDSTADWTEFPAAAYGNEVVWRSIVPKSNEMLGYMNVI